MPDDDRAELPDEPEAKIEPPPPDPFAPGMPLPPPPAMRVPLLGGSARAADRPAGRAGGIGAGGGGVLPPSRVPEGDQPRYLDSLDSADIDRVVPDWLLEPPEDFEG